MKSAFTKPVLLTVLVTAVLTSCRASEPSLSLRDPASSPSGHTEGMPASNSPAKSPVSIYRPELFPEQVSLPFGKGYGEALVISSPPEASWKLLASYPVADKSKLPPAAVHVYSPPEFPDAPRAFLEAADGTWYELGQFLTGVSGLHKDIPAVPFGAGNDVIRIGGGTDDGQPIIKMVYYKESTGEWMMDSFQMHDTRLIDLDGDGAPEWVGDQKDFVPPLVELQRWNSGSERFDYYPVQWTSDVSASADDERPSGSFLFQEEGKWFIEIFRAYEHAFFTYNDGVLIRTEPSDTKSRARAFMDSRSHMH
jgi:hypothetical protein